MKKLSYIILSLFLIFAPAYAYANSSIGGWTLTDSLIAGANTTIEATKTAGGKVLKSTVTVGASAAKVGKHLIKGGGSVALAYAMVELADGAIDWVLDPANNSVKVTYPSTDGTLPGDGTCASTGFTRSAPAGMGFHSTPEGACKQVATLVGQTFIKYDSGLCRMKTASGSDDQWGLENRGVCDASNPTFTPSGNGSVVNIPIDTVAAKVISNAEAGHGPSQEAVKATALEGFAAGDFDASLDASAVDATDTDTPVDPDAPTDPNAPPVPPPAFELPAFCSWAAPVCAFATWAQQEWSEFVLTITALKDWLFEEPAPNDADNTIDPTPVPITPVQVAIDFVGSCPAPLTFEYKIYNQTFKPAVPFTPMCEVAILINPVIKICASIGAIFIVAGIRQGNS